MILFKKIRFLFRLIIAVFKQHSRLVFFGLILGILFFLAFPRVIKHFPQPRKTLKIGLVGQYQINQLPDFILKDVSIGLTEIAENGEVKPALAKDWEIKDEGQTYIFNLKEEAFLWHDSKPFSPADINYNFEDVEVEIKERKMTFSLKEPFSPFLSVLSKPLFKKGLVGLGDYRVKKIEMKGKNVKSVFLVPFKKSQLPNKLYRFYNHEKDLKTAFNLGEIDIIKEVFDLQGLALGPGVKTNKILLKNAYLGIFFNTSRPPFSEKTFRQALAYAIDKGSEETRALGPLNSSSWAYNPDVKPYKKDIAHAQKLLENEKEGVENQKIKISTLSQYEPIANLAKESWAQIGLESEIHLISFIPQDFDVLIIAREIPEDPDQYYFWHSTQPGNLANFTSPRIDKLLEEGRKTIETDKRRDIYFDFQRFLVEESPVIFLSHPIAYTVIRD